MYGSVSVPNPNPAFHDSFIELDESNTEWCGHAYVEPCATQSSPSRSRRDTSQSNTDDQVVYISIEARDKDSSFAVNGIAGDVYRDVVDAPTHDSKARSLKCVSLLLCTPNKIQHVPCYSILPYESASQTNCHAHKT